MTPPKHIPLSSSPHQREDRARFNLVLQLSHQRPGKPPVERAIRFGNWLQSKDAPYIRELEVGEEWTIVERGWIKASSLLLVVNLGVTFKLNPSEEQRAEVEAKILELNTSGDTSPAFDHLVAPGRIHLGQTVSNSPILLRCRKGITNVVVYYFPI